MLRKAIVAMIILVAAVTRMAAEEKADTIVPADTVRHSSTAWIGQLINNGFRINDPDVDYPRFPRFVLDVYNWGDRTFNSYDSTYVVSTGKNWKIQAKNYNWLEYTVFHFPDVGRLSMHSNVFSDAGAYLSFMAVSVGYMFNVNNLIGRPATRHSFNVDFTCSRLSGALTVQSTEGGMTISRFGDYRDGARISQPLNDVRIKSMTGEIYYFFNHTRYSRAAAYCFSKYQLRSAGSWLLGVSFAKQSSYMDFSGLPAEMLEYLPLDRPEYYFRYNDYTLIGGYGYNWVIRPRRWLVNVTGLVAGGYKHSYEQSTDGRRDMVANNLALHSSVVYNHRALFASLNIRATGFMYFTSKFFYMPAFVSATLTVGARF